MPTYDLWFELGPWRKCQEQRRIAEQLNVSPKSEIWTREEPPRQGG